MIDKHLAELLSTVLNGEQAIAVNIMIPARAPGY
jgi:hypothetical protein